MHQSVRFFLPFILPFVFPNLLLAQITPACPVPPPPGAESCANTCVYCDFNGYTGANNGTPSGGNTVCGEIFLHNDQWFGFVAGSNCLTINIATSNCATGNGLQSAFFASCNEESLVCNPGQSGGEGLPHILNYCGFEPGSTYYLMVDGWTGDVCTYTIEVLEGSITPPAPVQPQPISGITQICPGATVVYSIPDVDNASYYHWTAPPGSSINGGSSNMNIPAPEGNQVTITFGAQGGQVCVGAANACWPEKKVCINVTNKPLPPTIRPSIEICYEDRPFEWDEAPYTTLHNPGTYALSSSPYTSYLGCDSVVKQTIVIKQQIKKNIGVQNICEGSCFTFNGNKYCQSGGPYQEFFTSAQGCDSLVEFSVNVVPAIATIAPIGQIDCASPTLLLNGSNSTTNANTTYRWVNASGTQLGTAITQSISSGGTYSLIVTNTTGTAICRDTATITVDQNTTLPDVNASGTNINCLKTNAQLQANSSTPGVNYLWSGPGITPAKQKQQSPSVSQAGLYTVVVTNPLNSCTSSASVSISADTLRPGAAASGSLLTCVQEIITLDGSSNASGVVWRWVGPDIHPGNQDLQDPPIALPGTYTLTVTNPANGCSSTASTSVSQNITPPQVSAGADKTLNCYTPSLALDGSGSPANVQLQWTGPGISVNQQSQPKPQISQPGLYVLTATDPANGCLRRDTASVAADFAKPIANAGPDTLINCYHPDIRLGTTSSSQGITFIATWSGAGIFSGNQNEFFPLISQPDPQYILSVLNTANGCATQDTVRVEADLMLPTAIAGPDATLTCSMTGGLQLQGAGSPAGAVEFSWSGPGIGVNNHKEQMPTITQPGDYKLTVTNPVNGCTSTDLVVVGSDINLPAASAGTDQTLNCTTKSVLLNGSASASGPGITYHWAGPGITSANDTLLSPANISTPGTYTLSVTNTANNCINTDIVVVLLDTLAPIAQASPALILNCYNLHQDTLDGSASSAGPTFAYLWKGPGISASNQSQQSPLIQVAGTYMLSVSNLSNTCTATATVEVSEDIASPTADAGLDPTIDCVTTSTAIGGNSSLGTGFSYHWAGPMLDSLSSTQRQPIVSIPGLYALTVTDTDNGCTSTDVVQVHTTAIYPAASAGADGLLTCAFPAFTLDGAASSSGADIQYTWAGPGINAANQAQQSPAISLPGLYVLTVRNNANNCAATDSVVILENKKLPLASAPDSLRLDCATTSVLLDGSPSSAGTTITYGWAGPAGFASTKAAPTAFLPGNYVLQVSDTQNGCTAIASTTVSQDIEPPLASAGPTQLLTCTAQKRTLNGSASSTGADFTYLWEGPGINTSNFSLQNPVVADSGLYLLTVTRLSNHCTATATVAVGQNTEQPTANAGPDLTLSCTVTSVVLDGSQSAGGSGISYAWSGPALNPPAATTLQATATGPGIYTLVVTDAANGCTSVDVANVSEDVVPPTANAGPDQTLNCANAATGIALSSAGSSSGADYALSWAGPGITPANQNQPNPTVNLIGTYILTLHSLLNGCIHTDTASVLQDQDLPTADAGPDQTLTCAVTKVTLDASGSSDLGGGIEYIWAGPGISTNNQGQETPDIEVPGTYTLTVMNLLTGCATTNEVSVLTNTLPPGISLLSEVLSCAQPSGELSAVTTPATGCTYDWAGAGINSGNIHSAAFQVTQAGLYAVTVTGPNGCSATASTMVTEDADLPNGSAEGTILNCKNGGKSSLTGQVNTPGASAQWQGPGGLVSDSLTIAVTQPGLYQFVITASNGCKRSIPVNVLPDYSAPIVQLWAAKKLTCSVTSVIIGTGGTSTGGHFSYSWSTANGHIISGDKGLAPVVDQAGAYTLLVTNLLNGCTSTGSILVENDPSVPTALHVAARDVRCFGENNGSLRVVGVTGGMPPFVYSLNGAPAVQTDQFPALAPGSYTLSLEDANGCLIDTTLLIREPHLLSVALGPDVELQLGDSAHIEAIISHQTPLAAWLWNYAPNCSPADACTAFTYLPLSTYVHRLTVRDSNGCTASDEVLVRVRKERLVYVPNIFSPASTDPDNFHLMIYGGTGVARVRIWQIFDRWGNAVFAAQDFLPNDSRFAWDGKIHGEQAASAVYVWVAELEFVDGEVEVFKGDVTIFR